MPSILFVCTANRFRSPIAAISFARQAVKEGDDRHLYFSSAGTWAVNGLPVTPQAEREAKKFDLDLSLHKSRLVTEKILDQVDLVLVMEANHREALTLEYPSIAGNIYLLSEVATGVPYDIPDPYVTNEPPDVITQEIIEMIDRGYDNILERLHTVTRKNDNR